MERIEFGVVPDIVTLCGSTRFRDEFMKANADLTMRGFVVLSVGFFMHNEQRQISDLEKRNLDLLHFRKIEMSGSIYVVNVEGYVGSSTAREIAYAVARHKGIEWLDPTSGETFMETNSHRLGRMVASFVEGRVPELTL